MFEFPVIFECTNERLNIHYLTWVCLLLWFNFIHILTKIIKKTYWSVTKCFFSSSPWSYKVHKVGFPSFFCAQNSSGSFWQAAWVVVVQCVCVCVFTTALLFSSENSQHAVAHQPLARHRCQTWSAGSSLPFQLALPVQEQGQEHRRTATQAPGWRNSKENRWEKCRALQK